MTDITTGTRAITPRAAQGWEKLLPMALLVRPLQRLLARISRGEIAIVLPNGKTLHHRAGCPGPSAKLVVRRWRTLWRLMTGGEMAFADAYIAGDWWSPNLTAFLEFGACNDDGMRPAIKGNLAQRAWRRLRHWRNRNTKRGSRRNIAAHYDLGNDFYRLWLDRGMQYSSALFTAPGQRLEDAQQTKLNRVAQMLELTGGERVLEIGCGWGALMERLLPWCDVTGVTLSAEQLAYARQRLDGKGFAGRAELRLQDYRDIAERYDRIVSIEMVEAVGEQYWPIYFEKLRNALMPGGTVVLQAITIAADRFDDYRRQPDFIQRHIFPGGVLPTVDIINQHAARAGFDLIDHEPFGLSYARTLAVWRGRFFAAWPEIERLGFDAAFKRMWDYYLSYCEAGFRQGAIDVGLYRFRPRPSGAVAKQ
jgi:cyclopropane-fatty-acyl-phospholipid synthase